MRKTQRLVYSLRVASGWYHKNKLRGRREKGRRGERRKGREGEEGRGGEGKEKKGEEKKGEEKREGKEEEYNSNLILCKFLSSYF